MEKETIMIDMDDVIVSGGFLYLINEFLNTNYKESDFKEFYMQDVIPNKQEFFKWFQTQNVYQYSELKKDVVEVLEQLNREYNIYIGTSYIFREIPNESGFVLKQKHDFLVKNFPFINPYNFIFLANKNLLNCDIKIDDRIDNLNNAKRKILYTAYHNEDISNNFLMENGIERANGWQDVKRLLLKK